MLGKLSIITAVAGIILIPGAAFAGSRGGHERGHERSYERERRHERREGRHERRHWYHGRWWDYGEGPCWRRAGPVWIWICG
jgi:hypothetical protein